MTRFEMALQFEDDAIGLIFPDDLPVAGAPAALDFDDDDDSLTDLLDRIPLR